MFENNVICKLLQIEYPIFQGGMAWIGTAELASAVSNAGGLGIIACGGAPLRQDIEEFFSVNVFGAMKLARAVIPRMRGAKGSIVSVASDAALEGNVQCSLYSATKGALTSFTRSLALELTVDEIRANVVCPGDVDTPLLERQLAVYGGSREEMAEWYPLGRIAKASEVGEVIAFLISERSSFMTGAVIPVDGGLTDW